MVSASLKKGAQAHCNGLPSFGAGGNEQFPASTAATQAASAAFTASQTALLAGLPDIATYVANAASLGIQALSVLLMQSDQSQASSIVKQAESYANVSFPLPSPGCEFCTWAFLKCLPCSSLPEMSSVFSSFIFLFIFASFLEMALALRLAHSLRMILGLV